MNTKVYPYKGVYYMETINQVNTFKNYLKFIMKDPIIEILLKNSCFTKVQLETILIDIYYRENKEMVSQDEKLSLRKNQKISRGSFNRTRKQAIKNIVKSIYTLLLLGYIGLLEKNQINPFIEISYRLKTLRENIKLYNNNEMSRNLIKDLISEVEEVASGKIYYE